MAFIFIGVIILKLISNPIPGEQITVTSAVLPSGLCGDKNSPKMNYIHIRISGRGAVFLVKIPRNTIYNKENK